MKTFTAEEFNKHPAQVYREADKSGNAVIKHARYPDVVFVLSLLVVPAKEEK